MAELSPEGIRAVLGVFCDAYNESRCSAYALTLIEPPADLSCDYVFEDPARLGEPLKIQLTRSTLIVNEPGPSSEAGVGARSRQMHAWIHDKAAIKRPGIIHDSAADCAARAVRAKSDRLGPSATDLILLVYFDVKRYDEDVDLPEMRQAVSEIPHGFREVWAVWTFADLRGRADRLSARPH